MADITPIDRLTLKRNNLLSKRLQVRLQIMGDEYRMAKKDTDQHFRDLADFLVYIRHTVPGVAAYCQPDTRSLKANLVTVKRSSQARNLNDKGKVLHSQQSFIKRSSIVNSIGKDNPLLHRINSKNGESTGTANNESTNTHSDFCYMQETRSGCESWRSSAMLHSSRRTQSAKYGRNAYTQKDEALRQIIFNRFESIFDFYKTGTTNTINNAKTASSKDSINGCNRFHTMTTNLPSSEYRQQMSADFIVGSSSKQTLRNRLTLSAHTRPLGNPSIAHARPINTAVSDHVGTLTTMPKRQQSSCKNDIVDLDIFHLSEKQTTMLNSTEKIQNQNLSTVYSQEERLPDSVSVAVVPSNKELTLSAVSMSSLGEEDGELKLQSDQHQRKTYKRPKTAPPNYELKQKSVSVPRQQVAGFQAEAHSKRAETQAILKKSKQIQEMVKTMVPTTGKHDDQQDNEDSVADDKET